MDITHKNGIWWYEAPAPPRKHEHVEWTVGWTSSLLRVARCPCGAMKLDRGIWVPEGSPRVAYVDTAKRGERLKVALLVAALAALFLLGAFLESHGPLN